MSFFWSRVQPINEDTLSGTGLSIDDVYAIADIYGFEPVGIYVSDLDIFTYKVREWGVLTAIREFIQNAMDAQCGPKIMCRPSIEYKNRELYISNTGDTLDETFIVYGYSTKRESSLGASFLYRGHFGEGAKGAISALLFEGRRVAIYSRRHNKPDFVIFPVVKKVVTEGGRALHLLSYIVGESNLATQSGASVVVRLDATEDDYYASRQLVFAYWLEMLKERGVSFAVVPVHEYVDREVYEWYLESITPGNIRVKFGDVLSVSGNTITIPRDMFRNYVVLIYDKDVQNRVYVKDIFVGDEGKLLDSPRDPTRTHMYQYDTPSVSYNLYYAQLEPNRRKLTYNMYVSDLLFISSSIYAVMEYLLKYRHKVTREGDIVIFDSEDHFDIYNTSYYISNRVKLSMLDVANIAAQVVGKTIDDFMESGIPVAIAVEDARGLNDIMKLFSALHVHRGIVIVNKMLAKGVDADIDVIKELMKKRMDTTGSVTLTGYPYDQVAQTLRIIAIAVASVLTYGLVEDVYVTIDLYKEGSEMAGYATKLSSKRWRISLGKYLVDAVVNDLVNYGTASLSVAKLMSVFAHEMAHVVIGEEERGGSARPHGERFADALEKVFTRLIEDDAYINAVYYALYGIVPSSVSEIDRFSRSRILTAVSNLFTSGAAADFVSRFLAPHAGKLGLQLYDIIANLAGGIASSTSPYMMVQPSGHIYIPQPKNMFEILRSVPNPTDYNVVAMRLFESSEFKFVAVLHPPLGKLMFIAKDGAVHALDLRP